MLRRENWFVLNCGIVIRNVGVTRRERSHHHSPTPSGSGRGCYTKPLMRADFGFICSCSRMR